MLQFGDTTKAKPKSSVMVLVAKDDIEEMAHAIEQIELGIRGTPLELWYLNWLSLKETMRRLAAQAQDEV